MIIQAGVAINHGGKWHLIRQVYGPTYMLYCGKIFRHNENTLLGGWIREPSHRCKICENAKR